MSRKDIRNLIILVVCLAIGSDLVWNLIQNNKVNSVATVTRTATVTAIPTATPTATNTTVPTATATRTPMPTPEHLVRSSYGDYYDCDTDPVTEECICVVYHYTITMTRENCGSHLCSTKIDFTNEYGDGTTMWIDYFDVQASIPVHNGEVVALPKFDPECWSIGPRALFETTPTP